MYNFVLQTLIMLSLGTTIYLMVRALPRVSEEGLPDFSRDYFGKLLKRLPLEKADAWVSAVLEKFLRKTKIVILKIDNLLTKHLASLRSASSDRSSIFSFKGESLFEQKPDASGGERKEENSSADIDIDKG